MVLGQGLIRARERMGYRQEDTAAALGVARAMISYWENGRREPSDPQLAALARLYRTSAAALLSGEGREKPDEAEMLFRGGGAGAPDRARPGIWDFLDFLGRYERLAELLGAEMRGMQSSPFLGVEGAGTADDIRRKAEEVRAYLRIGLGPIADIDALCALFGVTVYRALLGSDLSKTISGGFYAHPAVGFSLLVNAEMSPGRRRFTIAHELAHALFHSGPKTRFLLSGAVKSPRERFADRFAGEFLMPTEGIRRIMEEHGMGPRIAEPADVIHLQRCFNVSYATALVRLQQGGFLTQQNYRAFQSVRPVAFARALGYEIAEGEYSQEAGKLGAGRFPGRFLRLLRRAVRGGHISVPTAAEMTGLLIDDIEQLVAYLPFPPSDDRNREIEEYEITGVPF